LGGDFLEGLFVVLFSGELQVPFGLFQLGFQVFPEFDFGF